MTTRRIRYAVVTGPDGYIAGPKGEADWIIHNPEVDFGAIFSQFDTILVGRRTYEVMAAAGRFRMPGMKTLVFSWTLRQRDHPKVKIVAGEPEKMLATLKERPGGVGTPPVTSARQTVIVWVGLVHRQRPMETRSSNP